jgi:hypothetical protein
MTRAGTWDTAAKVLFEADVHVAGVDGIGRLIAGLVRAIDEDEEVSPTSP